MTGTKPQTIVKLFVKGWQQQRIVNSDPFFCKFIVGKRVLARACHGFRPIKSGSARHKHQLALKKEFRKNFQSRNISLRRLGRLPYARNKSTRKRYEFVISTNATKASADYFAVHCQPISPSKRFEYKRLRSLKFCALFSFALQIFVLRKHFVDTFQALLRCITMFPHLKNDLSISSQKLSLL